MSTRTGVLIGGGVVLLAVAVYLVITLPGKKGHTEEPVDLPVKRVKSEAPLRPNLGVPPPVPVGRPDAGRAAAPSDMAPVVKSTDDAKANRFGTAARPGLAEKLAHEAKVKQRDLYRTYVTNAGERVEKLTKVLQRLRKSGYATPEQLTQIQKQLQQTVDAAPRMKAQLQKIEEEIKADQEKAEREKKKQAEESQPQP